MARWRKLIWGPPFSVLRPVIFCVVVYLWVLPALD